MATQIRPRRAFRGYYRRDTESCRLFRSPTPPADTGSRQSYISVIKAVTLKIDGLIDLGPTWSYEYRIERPDKSPITQVRKHHLPRQKHASQEHTNNEEVRLQELEQRIRKEAENLRHHKYHSIPNVTDRAKVKKHSKVRMHHKSDTKSLVLRGKSPSEVKQEKEKIKYEKLEPKNKKPITTTTVTTKDPIPEPNQETEKRSEVSKSSSESEAIAWSGDSEDKTTQQKVTIFDLYDFTSPKSIEEKPVGRNKMLKPESEPLKKNSTPLQDDNLKNVTNLTEDSKLKVIVLDSDNEAKIKTTTVKPVVTIATIPTIPQITTVRTDEIYSAPHKVKDDEKIKEFTNHIVKQNLKVLNTIKNKINEYYMRKQVDVLAKSYQEKLHEFLRDTRHQNIKTRLGSQKVILNTIDMSNRILQRLINYMMGDMDKRGLLRNDVANIFHREIEKETKLELSHACKKFGICRSGAGFTEFLTDIIGIILKSKDAKFKLSIDALTEVVKSTDFHAVLDEDVETRLKTSIENLESFSPLTLRAAMMILKNIIWTKNKPLIVQIGLVQSRVNATLAFLETIDLLEQNSPANEANILEWNDIRKSMTEFSECKRNDIQDIMESFIKHLNKTISGMDPMSKKIISKNLDVILT